MALQIGAVAPDFEAETTEGKIKFHDWIGNGWALLFSHPKDFTPVCTTELGTVARMKPEFDKRGVKLIGLSVDPVDRHAQWAEDIKETQGTAPNYPMIGDTDLKVSKLYDMLPASASGDVLKRTAADNQTARQDDQAGAGLSHEHRPQFSGDPACHRLASDDRETPHFDTGGLETRRRRHHFRFGERRRSQEDLSAGLEIAKAVYPDRAAAEVIACTPKSITRRRG
jgi:peroxiredoxin